MTQYDEVEYELASEWVRRDKIFVTMDLKSGEELYLGEIEDIVKDVLKQELALQDWNTRQHIDLDSLEVLDYECRD